MGRNEKQMDAHTYLPTYLGTYYGQKVEKVRSRRWTDYCRVSTLVPSENHMSATSSCIIGPADTEPDDKNCPSLAYKNCVCEMRPAADVDLGGSLVG